MAPSEFVGPLACASDSEQQTHTSDPQRVEWVDYSKGWCIILVVMMHSSVGVGLAIGETGWMHSIVAFAKPFRMPDFFVISGLFVHRLLEQSVRAFVDRKVFHFLYFCAVWSFVILLVKGHQMGLSSPADYIEAYAWSFIQPLSTLWFIALLPTFMLLVYVTQRVPNTIVLCMGVILHVLASSRPIGGIYTMESGLTGWTTIDGFCMYFVYFFVGHICSREVFRLSNFVRTHPSFAIAPLATWIALEAVSVHKGLTEVPGLTLVYGLLGACVLIMSASILSENMRVHWLAWLGRHSLVIYLSFFLPMAASRTLLMKTALAAFPGVMSLVVTIAAVTGSLLLHHITKSTSFSFLFNRPGWARLL